MHWLIVSDLNTSLRDLVNGVPLSQGTPVPAKFVEYLCEAGEKVSLVLPRASSDPPYRESRWKNLKITQFPFRTSWKRIFDGPTMHRILKQVVTQERPDLIYASGYYAIWSSLFARTCSIPCFTRMYGTFLTQLLNFDTTNFAALPKLLAEFVELALAKDGLILTNDGTQGDRVCARLGVPKERLYFPYNGLDKSQLRSVRNTTNIRDVRAKYGVSEQDFLITNVSRLASWKRVDLVISAFGDLADRSRSFNRNPMLLIVGDGTQKRDLTDLARRSRLSDRIRFVGGLKRRDALELLRSSDVATSFYEVSNVGNVLLEAMQLGTFVIARDTGDTAKIISHNRTGALTPADADATKTGFVAAIERVQQDLEFRLRVSRQAVDWCDRTIPDWEQRFQDECNWIEERLPDRSSGRAARRVSPKASAA